MDTLEIATKLANVRQQIADCAYSFHRKCSDIQLVAVSKTKTVEAILAAYAAGQRAFGENYVREAIEKIQFLKNYPDIEWHFIGTIQANKTRLLAENFQWVQSLDNFHHAQRLHQQRPAHLLPLNVCIQVNINDETQKSGVSLSDTKDFASKIMELSRLRLRGLMTIPAAFSTFEAQRANFHQLTVLYQDLQMQGFDLDTLSMGMSSDLAAAIAEGATMVRVGTAIFGSRDTHEI